VAIHTQRKRESFAVSDRTSDHYGCALERSGTSSIFEWLLEVKTASTAWGNTSTFEAALKKRAARYD
jgi:phosphate-selective porin